MARFDASAHLPLRPAMFQVLVALADGEKHGYAIIKEVARRTDGKVRLRAGTLYTAIRRFVDVGLIQESAERLVTGPVTAHAKASTSRRDHPGS